eukprot:COSAG01_NODE_7541_length_3158_cov_22.404707_4_plen_60_part_00
MHAGIACVWAPRVDWDSPRWEAVLLNTIGVRGRVGAGLLRAEAGREARENPRRHEHLDW